MGGHFHALGEIARSIACFLKMRGIFLAGREYRLYAIGGRMV